MVGTSFPGLSLHGGTKFWYYDAIFTFYIKHAELEVHIFAQRSTDYRNHNILGKVFKSHIITLKEYSWKAKVIAILIFTVIYLNENMLLLDSRIFVPILKI